MRLTKIQEVVEVEDYVRGVKEGVEGGQGADCGR